MEMVKKEIPPLVIKEVKKVMAKEFNRLKNTKKGKALAANKKANEGEKKDE